MTPTSQSRGIMYSAPPEKTARNDENKSVADEPTESVESAEASDDRISPGSDANWTGAVPADD